MNKWKEREREKMEEKKSFESLNLFKGSLESFKNVLTFFGRKFKKPLILVSCIYGERKKIFLNSGV